MLNPDYHTDIDWLHKISHRLDRFASASTTGKTFVCRCPYCGDSQKSKKKVRLYFYTKKSALNFDCKNCGAHGSFWTFMKDQCVDVYDQYKKDQMLKRLDSKFNRSKNTSNQSNSNQQTDQTNLFRNESKKDLIGCISLSELPDTHTSVKYLYSRHFDRDQINKLFYSENFKVTAEHISSEPLSEHFPTEPRIVIPFYDDNKNVEMIQGRSLDPNAPLRYISIKSHDDIVKIYGKEFVDPNKLTYCVEGPLDSLFVDNCYATCDSSLQRCDADVLIWDNEPMNEQIIDLMDRAIDNNRSIVIWPTSPTVKMDINDMIKMGINRYELMEIIKSRTFHGIRAKLEFTKWKRV